MPSHLGHFCLGSVCLDILLKSFLCIQGQYKKRHKYILQFVIVTYNMGFYVVLLTLSKWQWFISFEFLAISRN